MAFDPSRIPGNSESIEQTLIGILSPLLLTNGKRQFTKIILMQVAPGVLNPDLKSIVKRYYIITGLVSPRDRLDAFWVSTQARKSSHNNKASKRLPNGAQVHGDPTCGTSGLIVNFRMKSTQGASPYLILIYSHLNPGRLSVLNIVVVSRDSANMTWTKLLLLHLYWIRNIEFGTAVCSWISKEALGVPYSTLPHILCYCVDDLVTRLELAAVVI